MGWKIGDPHTEETLKLLRERRKEKNPNWKGDKVTKHIGNKRARRWFGKKPCERCGSEKSEIHHKDDNTLNNNPDNIQFLCRKHHMLIDGRFDKFMEMASKSKLSDDDIREIRRRYKSGETSVAIAKDIDISSSYAWQLANYKRRKELKDV